MNRFAKFSKLKKIYIYIHNIYIKESIWNFKKKIFREFCDIVNNRYIDIELIAIVIFPYDSILLYFFSIL